MYNESLVNSFEVIRSPGLVLVITNSRRYFHCERPEKTFGSLRLTSPTSITLNYKFRVHGDLTSARLRGLGVKVKLRHDHKIYTTIPYAVVMQKRQSVHKIKFMYQKEYCKREKEKKSNQS